MTLPVRLGVCILPTSRWADSRATWIDLDIAGVDHLWTYDHLSWRDLRDGPWFGAMPLLTAVASVTSRAMVGPIVASPNFRHPVPFAKEVLTAADISEGRFVCGIGAGGIGWDATVLGRPAWPRAERTARFEEFTDAAIDTGHLRFRAGRRDSVCTIRRITDRRETELRSPATCPCGFAPPGENPKPAIVSPPPGEDAKRRSRLGAVDR